MNNRFRQNPIFKAPKDDPKEKSLFRLQKNKIENSKRKFFRLYISNDMIEVFIGTMLNWDKKSTNPQLKDFITIQTEEKTGFIILLHTLEAHKKNPFMNAFGKDNVEIPPDVKGEKNLDNFEAQIDRNTSIYYRPEKRHSEFDLHFAMMKMCDLFEIQYRTSIDDDDIMQEDQDQLPFNPNQMDYKPVAPLPEFRRIGDNNSD